MTPESTPAIAADLDTSEGRLASTLQAVDFPATRDDLLRAAVVAHLDVGTIGAIHDLAGGDYHGVAEVLRALGLQQSPRARTNGAR